MNIVFKITTEMVQSIRADLLRPHPLVHERVGFISCGVGSMRTQGVIVLAHKYYPVDNDDYEEPVAAGTQIGRSAIRKALQIAYTDSCSLFHIHMHLHKGKPFFSKVDDRENSKLIPNFWNVQPDKPHGAIVLSFDGAAGNLWHPNHTDPISIKEIIEIGAPIKRL